MSLFRGGEKIPMGKREAQFVTLRQLRDEVGNDACRFFYLMRSHDQPLDFDLELAKSRTNENPVYYIQYAHARVASVMKQLAARGLALRPARRPRAISRCSTARSEQARAAAALALSGSPSTQAARESHAARTGALPARAGQRLPHLLQRRRPFIVEDAPLRNARLRLARRVQQVMRNGLTLLGVSAPESM